MHHARQMIEAHSHPPTGDIELFEDCVHACFDCAHTCTSCADACLGEPNVGEMVRCIRLNSDCADVCVATGRLVSRSTETDISVLRAQLQACVAACRACGDECDRHGQHMEHCRVCAEACRSCERACQRLLEAVAA